MRFLQVFVVFAVFALSIALSPDCPTFTQVTVCSPKCKDDGDCVALGGKCCPNLCNHKSCVTKGNTNKSGDNKCKWNSRSESYDYSRIISQITQTEEEEATVATWNVILLRSATWTEQQSAWSAFEAKRALNYRQLVVNTFWKQNFLHLTRLEQTFNKAFCIRNYTRLTLKFCCCARVVSIDIEQIVIETK